MTERDISARITTKQAKESVEIIAFWRASLAIHREANHETFGWHCCPKNVCKERQTEFDRRFVDVDPK